MRCRSSKAYRSIRSRTALELRGLGHYIKMSSRDQVILWKTPEVRLPLWFKNYNKSKSQLEVRSATLFPKDDQGLSTKTLNQGDITISSAERTIMEYLYDVPKREGFDEANYIMEGLASLRPNTLQQLLESCKSIRVKRLFICLAEDHNHRWFERLDSSTIDFWESKRKIMKGENLIRNSKL
ncbi:type IV toxin-antitoxin system AbiEi family antitoxin domain-containing protein [Fodinibius salsisoli]|uniref:Type IV toxin-antitoxin system AbiEi family antitoxin domain-containing protein n=1 Tax=Fodinibius salsisoli TaxID=2820877 RepID=A0ABT3PII1_9BACT|nr:type IV toxin-antitoxin system AbiEi family antitoxin domain-containing protein [Fodinibius salsisoli]MCW9705738.1 type IV toxin-antitoxin system AbiEi family antitoxin domain-containing protein [Fodinibius salsisoli]